jgi:hypothetical protein
MKQIRKNLCAGIIMNEENKRWFATYLVQKRGLKWPSRSTLTETKINNEIDNKYDKLKWPRRSTLTETISQSNILLLSLFNWLFWKILTETLWFLMLLWPSICCICQLGVRSLKHITLPFLHSHSKLMPSMSTLTETAALQKEEEMYFLLKWPRRSTLTETET